MMQPRQRARQRGAAMVEGVIVVGTMLVFAGTIMFTQQSYGIKLTKQQTTRSNVLYFASHGCEQGGGAQMSGGGSATEGSPEAEAAAGKSTVPGKEAATRSWNSASATDSGSANWQAVWDSNNGQGAMNLEKHGLSRSISAASHTTCNEKKYSSQWSAWFEFGIDFVTRGFGGAGDLFK